tara:strand:+ start:9319 stop:10743 length:1425 start_codon:yes stop_codon:yes gene_type:complete
MVSFGQTKDGVELCLAAQKYSKSFITDKEAENALGRILSVIGGSKNFTLQTCDDINNALAVTYNGNRYILYDKKFMQLITQYTNNWSNMFILAHEVGHHINGHTRDVALGAVLNDSSLQEQRQEELEADKFAGFVLAKLGASLNQTIAAIDLISSNSDDRYSTHPNKNKRIEAIKEGYSGGATRITNNQNSSSNNKRSSTSISGYWTKEKIESLPFSDGSEPSNRAYVIGKLNPVKNNFSQPKLIIERYNDLHKVNSLSYHWKSSYDVVGSQGIDNRLSYVLKISNLKINTFSQKTSYIYTKPPSNQSDPSGLCQWSKFPCPEYVTIEFVFDDQSKLSTNNALTRLIYGRQIKPIIKRSKENQNQIVEVSFPFYKIMLDDGVIDEYPKKYGQIKQPYKNTKTSWLSKFYSTVWDEYLINYLKTKDKVFIKITVPDQNDEHISEYFEFSLSGSTKALDFLIPHGNNVPGSSFNKF